MKSLQEYILENVDQNVNEGKIWDAIKDWFKKLFEPSDREFDRYNPDNTISGSNLANYEKYLEENFEFDNLKSQEVLKSDLKKIVYPNGEEPNKDGEIGFYNFIDNINKKKDNTKYFVFIYEDKKVKDAACLVNYISDGETIEILNLQIIKEFIPYIDLKKTIELLSNDDKFKEKAKKIAIKETTNKELYKQLINDCEFISKFDKDQNSNIASKEI